MEALYKKFNYPGKQKFYQLAKKEGLKVTLKDIDEFLNKQHVSQVFSKKVVQKPGHIVAFNPDERIEMDLIDMTKFDKKNKGYGWIFLLVDIFTRKAYAYMMKNKTEGNIEDILTQFFEKHKPDVIISDNESGFKSKIVQKLMDKNEVYHSMVEPQDHKALGVVDRCVQSVKNAIYKHMKGEGTTKYIDELPRIIEAYNDTPNQGIEDIAPNDANQKENVETLQILNHQKNLKNIKNRVAFAVGDTVRIKQKQNPFARSYDEKYSEKQYTIDEIEDRKAALDDGQVVGLRRLIKVQKLEIAPKDELSKAKRESRIGKALKKEGLDIDSKEFKKPSRLLKQLTDFNPKGNRE